MRDVRLEFIDALQISGQLLDLVEWTAKACAEDRACLNVKTRSAFSTSRHFVDPSTSASNWERNVRTGANMRDPEFQPTAK